MEQRCDPMAAARWYERGPNDVGAGGGSDAADTHYMQYGGKHQQNEGVRGSDAADTPWMKCGGRLDRWLCHVKVFPSLSAARRACKAGAVRAARAASVGCRPATGISPRGGSHVSRAWVVSDAPVAKATRSVAVGDAFELRRGSEATRSFELIQVDADGYSVCHEIDLPTGWADERLQRLASIPQQGRTEAQKGELRALLSVLHAAETPQLEQEPEPEGTVLSAEIMPAPEAVALVRTISGEERARRIVAQVAAANASTVAEAADKELQLVLLQQVAFHEAAACKLKVAKQTASRDSLTAELLPYGRQTHEPWAITSDYLGSEAASVAAGVEAAIHRRLLVKRLCRVSKSAPEIRQPEWWSTLRVELDARHQAASQKQASIWKRRMAQPEIRAEFATYCQANLEWVRMSEQEKLEELAALARVALLVSATQRLALACVLLDSELTVTVDPELVWVVLTHLMEIQQSSKPSAIVPTPSPYLWLIRELAYVTICVGLDFWVTGTGTLCRAMGWAASATPLWRRQRPRLDVFARSCC